MEQEKDDRQYGAMEDVLARSDAPAHAHRKWLEILKIVIPSTNFAEYAAMKCVAQLIDTVENAELRQGYMAQMIDEVRHTHQQMYLNRYFAKHAPDPDGFAYGIKYKGRDLFGRASRTAFETFFMGDPIEGALNLQVIAETAYTNPVFVAMTEVAALQGDQATPSVFLSVQSDEARHMANGYSTLAAIVSNEDNLPLLQADFERAFWRQHTFIDPFVAGVYDYAQVNRSSSYLEKWKEWIAEDWVGLNIARLEPFGLKAPTTARARRGAGALVRPHRRHGRHRRLAAGVLAAAGAHPRRLRVVREQVPGVVRPLRLVLRGLRGDVRAGLGQPLPALPGDAPALPGLPDALHLPPASTSTPSASASSRAAPRLLLGAVRAHLRRGPRPLPRLPDLLGDLDGHGLDEYIVKQGLLRGDGRTLLPQPHNSDDPKMMWTLDDIKALDVEIKDPLSNPDSIYVA